MSSRTDVGTAGDEGRPLSGPVLFALWDLELFISKKRLFVHGEETVTWEVIKEMTAADEGEICRVFVFFFFIENFDRIFTTGGAKSES